MAYHDLFPAQSATELDEFKASLLEHDDEVDGTKTRSWGRRCFTMCWILSLVLCTAIAGLIGYAKGLSKCPQNCVKKHSYFSPALDAIPDEYIDVRINGSLNQWSPYKGPPGREVDNSWLDLVAEGEYYRLSKDELAQYGIDPAVAVEFAPEVGGGYFAGIGYSHHIHCLFLLWQKNYPDYYVKHGAYWQKNPGHFTVHLDHCADLLRQEIMCTADVGFTPYVWVEGYEDPYPVMSSPRKCKDLSQLQVWKEENHVRLPPGTKVKRLPGQQELSTMP